MNKGVHAFPKGINTKGNVIARLEFELTYYDVVVQYTTYYATGTPPVLLTNVFCEKIREQESKRYSFTF